MYQDPGLGKIKFRFLIFPEFNEVLHMGETERRYLGSTEELKRPGLACSDHFGQYDLDSLEPLPSVWIPSIT